MPAINSVALREKLPPRLEPYRVRITQGRHIAFRKWYAWHVDRSILCGERHYFHPLGDFSSLTETDRYNAAKKAADDWFVHPGFLRRYKGIDQLIQSFIDLRRPIRRSS